MPTTPFDRRPSDAVRADINNRANGVLHHAIEDAYQADLLRWAREDDAPFPDRTDIRTRIEEELLVLCSGLGSWAAAHPGEFFAGIDKRIRDAERRNRWDH